MYYNPRISNLITLAIRDQELSFHRYRVSRMYRDSVNCRDLDRAARYQREVAERSAMAREKLFSIIGGLDG